MNSIAQLDDGSGTVVLRGHTIEIGSDIGAAFVLDICRHVESLLSAEALRAKYGLLDDAAWQQLATNEPLQRAVGRQKELRIRNGEAAREKAAHLFVEAPNVLGDIIKDNTASPRHRVDAIRELRACTGIGAEASTPANDRERFVITLNFGQGHVLHKEIELKPITPAREEEEPPLDGRVGT
jgi:hypothetical protein